MTELNDTLLKKKKESLISGFLKGRRRGFPEKLAYLLDEYLYQCYETGSTGVMIDMIKNPYAIIALGSYGRKEPCIRSDVALLFLFEQSVPEEAQQLIKEYIYPLWDSGFEVTHVVRTLDECFSGAEQDVDVLTSLLDSRFICGMSRLFFRLNEGLRDTIVNARPTNILTAIVEMNKTRHDKFGDSTFLLEPNLKEGKGSLSDYDAILSIARVADGLRESRELAYAGYLSEKEFDEIHTSLSFILMVRNMLHHLTGRKCDQLFMEYQPRIAELLGYAPKDGQEAVECFMGDLHSRMRSIKQQYKVFLAELGYLGDRTPTGRMKVHKTRVKGLTINDKNMLAFSSMEKLLESPELLVKIFAESASLKVPLSAEAQRMVRDLAPSLVTPTYRSSRSVVRAFEKVLLTPAPEFNVVEAMVRTGLMEGLIPEFKGIINRIQYNEYHLFPVDKHSLMTVREAKTFADPEKSSPLCHELFEALPNKLELMWACLLHDIGKSDIDGLHSEKGAALSIEILKRLGYGNALRETVSFLVREHLFLAKMATRRDIQDEETAVFCARRIKTEHHLALLYLLTVADSRSTGPKAWNDWTHSLFQDLYYRTLNILRKDEFEPDEAIQTLERKKSELQKRLTAEGMEDPAFEKLFGLLSLRYILNVPSDDMASHARLYNKLEAAPFVWDIQGEGAKSPRILTVAAKNRPGLFSRIAGVLTLCGFNILDAQIHTWKNNTALDIFHLSPPADLLFESDKWKRAAGELTRALTSDINLTVRIEEQIRHEQPRRRLALRQEPRIDIDNETSGYFTIIEVHSDDYPGLLFSITHALFKCGLDIYVSKIATNMDQVVDIFYVRNFYGEKVVSPEQILEVKKEISQVLTLKNA